jgi:hypothetical protein
MIKSGVQVVDRVASNDHDLVWNPLIDRQGKAATVTISNDGVGVSVEESLKGVIEIADVFIGPFDLQSSAQKGWRSGSRVKQ